MSHMLNLWMTHMSLSRFFTGWTIPLYHTVFMMFCCMYKRVFLNLIKLAMKLLMCLYSGMLDNSINYSYSHLFASNEALLHMIYDLPEIWSTTNNDIEDNPVFVAANGWLGQLFLWPVCSYKCTLIDFLTSWRTARRKCDHASIFGPLHLCMLDVMFLLLLASGADMHCIARVIYVMQ